MSRKRSGDVTVTRDDLFSMLVGQVRYSLGRSSYIVGTACEQVRRYWRHLDAGEREVIERSVTSEFDRYDRAGQPCGMDIDHRAWTFLVAWMAENKVV